MSPSWRQAYPFPTGVTPLDVCMSAKQQIAPASIRVNTPAVLGEVRMGRSEDAAMILRWRAESDQAARSATTSSGFMNPFWW